MKWASHVSGRPSLEEALNECCDSVRTQLGPGIEPDLIVAFASVHHDQPDSPIPAALRARFPDAAIVGCSGAGVIGGGHEVEDGPGLSITAGQLPDVTLRCFHVKDSDLPSPDAAPEAWADLIDVPLDTDPAFLLLADPFSLDNEALLTGMDYAFPGCAKIGGLASGGGPSSPHALYLNDMLYREGAVGVALGALAVQHVVQVQSVGA